MKKKINDEIVPNIVEDTIGEAFSESKVVLNEAGVKSNIINDVCLFGNRVSKNGRTYSDKALESITKFAENVRVFVDHEGEKDSGVRSVKSFLGALNGIENRNGKIFAKEFRIHPDLTSWVEGLVEHFPDRVGFSINASGKIVKGKEGDVVEDVTKLFSVDLVSTPATTTSFFEHFDKTDEGDLEIMSDVKITLEMIESEYPHLVEAIVAKSEQNRKFVQLDQESKILKTDLAKKDEEITKLNKVVEDKDKAMVEKDKTIVAKDDENKTLKVKLDGYETKDILVAKAEMIEKIVKEAELPKEAITPIIREILMSIQPKKVKEGEIEKEVSVEDQIKTLVNDLKGVISKPAAVHGAGPVDDKGKGTITMEQFVSAATKR